MTPDLTLVDQSPHLRWYVVNSHPQKEMILYQLLAAHEFQVYYPYLKVKPVNPRCKNIRPFFPGYLFIKVDISRIGDSLLRWMPHSHGLVCFDGVPAPVPDDLIYGIQCKVDAHNTKFAPGKFQHGEQVKVVSGVFNGYDAIFDTSLPGSERVRVLLKMLNQRQVPLVLPAGQVEKAQPFYW